MAQGLSGLVGQEGRRTVRVDATVEGQDLQMTWLIAAAIIVGLLLILGGVRKT